MQAKRIQIASITRLAGQQNDVDLTSPETPREQINLHNIWGSVGCEPENADANANGWWVLYIRRKNAPNVTWTIGVANAEEENQDIIACGLWMAANQAAFTSEPIHPMTSRNLGPGDTLRLSAFVNGVSAGAVRVNVMLCAHTVRK